MSDTILWRTDRRKYDPHCVIESEGDHLQTLDGAHLQTEILLRQLMGDVRSRALYAWADEGWARRAWQHEPHKFLYRLSVERAHILHRGDVNHYTDIGKALSAGQSANKSLDDYIKSNESDRARYPTARMEVLVTEAVVLERFEH